MSYQMGFGIILFDMVPKEGIAHHLWIPRFGIILFDMVPKEGIFNIKLKEKVVQIVKRF